jgi:hypothetical protein
LYLETKMLGKRGWAPEISRATELRIDCRVDNSNVGVYWPNGTLIGTR